MQNWNQWQQVPTVSAPGPVPQPPSAPGYPAAGGADPMATMQAYMQYYNQPAPSGYTAEQWATAQQQNWIQWQQWQQQYQQWQTQYGSKYQSAMKQMEVSDGGTKSQPPPLPKEDLSVKPPLPPDSSSLSYSQKYGDNMNTPLPHQNNSPLFPPKKTGNPPLPPDQPPPPPTNPPNDNTMTGTKRGPSSDLVSDSAKKTKNEDDELTDTEKTFDKQFKEWEEQFNKWKQQNANHPDKAQYKQYEAKWTSWREKLIERREQMRAKREAQRAKIEEEKKKNLQGGEKILNILSTSENQGLLNNLLGIGKTLGLTGKEAEVKKSTTDETVQKLTMGGQIEIPGVPTTMTSDMNQHAWAAQQWAAQYNMAANMSISGYPTFQTSMMPPPIIPQAAAAIQPQNPALSGFNQPPPNFNQPPPNFSMNSQFNFGLQDSQNSQDQQNRPPPLAAPFRSDANSSQAPFQRDMNDQSGNNNNNNNNNNKFGDNRFEQNNKQSNDRYRGNDSFNRDGPSGMNQDSRNNEFSNDRFNNSRDEQQNRNFGGNNWSGGNDSFDNRDRFGGNRTIEDEQRFNRDDRRFREQNRFGSDKNDSNFDRGNNDWNGPNDRFGSGGNNNRFNDDKDRFNMDRQGGDRFGSTNNRFDSGNSNQQGRWDNKDNSNDTNNRSFGRNSRFDQQQPDNDIAPEVKKLLEKRRAAVDVFKPSSGSFLSTDSDKNKLGGSLGESFRKIAGDPPFIPKERPDFGRKSPGRNSFGPSGSDLNRFRDGDDSRNRDNDSFRSSEGPSDDFRSSGPGFPNFRPPGRSGPGNLRSGPDDFRPPGPNADNLRSRGPEDFRSQGPGNFGNFRDMGPPHQDKFPEKVPPLEMPPWMDPQLMPGPLSGNNPDFIDTNRSENMQKFPDKDTDDRQQHGIKNTEKLGISSSDVQQINEPAPFGMTKKSNDLPFMGENDPKPEDLNMEPPPEFPNLGPINPMTSAGRNNNIPPPIPPFENRPPRDNLTNRPGIFDSPFGGPGMPPNLPSTLGTRELGPAFGAGFDGRFSGPRDAGLKRDLPFNMPGRPDDMNPGMRGFPSDFGPQGPGNFGPRGPDNFGPRGSDDFGPRGLDNFGPRGLDNMGPRDSDNFGPRRPDNFGPRGPDDFGPRGPDNFGPRGRDDFGPRGPDDFGPRGPDSFGPRGLDDFGPRGPDNFGPRGPDNFGPRGLDDFGPRGLDDFGPRGLDNFGPRLDDFEPRRPDNFNRQDANNFGPRGPDNFGPRDFPNRPFGPPDNRGPNFPDFPPSGNCEPGMNNSGGPGNFGPRGSIPSLLEFKINTPPRLQADLIEDNIDRSMNRPRRDDLDRPPLDMNAMDNLRPPMQPDHRDIDRRNNFPSHELDRNMGRPFSPNRGRDDGIFKRPGQDIGPGRPLDVIPPPIGQDNEYSRRPDPQPGHRRDGPMRDFCVGKQFNYNHGGSARKEVFDLYIPSRVIDYGHIKTSSVQDYRTPPGQSFEYAHGMGKPIVPDHEIYPKMDFKYWLDNEHNINEYNEGMRIYQARKIAIMEEKARMADWKDDKRRYGEQMRFEEQKRYESRGPPPTWERDNRDYGKRQRGPDDYRDYKKHQDWREPRDRDSQRGDRPDNRGGRDRSRDDDDYDRNHEGNFGKSNSEDRTRDRSERTRRDNDYNRDEERSKSRQDNSAKTPPTKSSSHEPSDKDDRVTDEQQKTAEVAKMQNYTMVEDLLCSPGRQNRPPKIVIMLRGPPGGGKSYIAKLIKDKEMEQGGSAPRILSLDDYFLTEKDVESKDDNGKKIITKEMVYEYEEAMESSYLTSLVKAFKKNITDGFFNFIILDSINEKISDYEEMWSFAKTKGFKVYVCEVEMDVQICLKRNIHGRTEDEVNRIVDYFEPTPSYQQKLDVTSLLQEQAIQDVHMEEAEVTKEGKSSDGNDDSQDSQEENYNFGSAVISKWEKMEADNKLDRLDGLAKRKNEGKPQTMEDFLQVPDYYNMEDTSGKKRVRWADLEEKKEQEKMRAMGFVIGQTNWDRMLDPTQGSSALTKTKYI